MQSQLPIRPYPPGESSRNRKRFPMIHRLALLALLTGFLVPGAPSAQTAMVLVASTQSPIVHVGPDEARRLYLGLPLLVDGRQVRPLRNGVDPQATEIFLQHVMYMSSDAYERQMRKRSREAGGDCPPLKTDQQDLLQALSGDPMAVTYMRRSQAIDGLPLRIVGEM